MTLPGVLRTANALSYYTRREEVTANNLANVTTDGFKLDRLTAVMRDGRLEPQPVAHLDLRQGPLRETGRALDLALSGPGFFVIETEHGERLVRGGALQIDVQGRLVDAEGRPVLGRQGPIFITGPDVVIQPDGTVVVDGAQVDRLRIELPEEGTQLRKEGGGRFVADGPTRPVDPHTVTVRQGFVEQPNGDVVLGMVDLIAIQRAYAANVDALKAMDGVLGTIAGELGRP